MAKNGRPRTPVAIAKLKGLKIQGQEPAFEDGLPECPGWFSEATQQRWQFWVEHCLSIPGMIKQVDFDAWVVMATAWEEFDEASRLIAKQGIVSISEKGSPYMNPAVGVRHAAMKTIMNIARDYGFTPTSRAGMVFEKPEEKDDLEQLMAEREGS